MRYYLIYNSIIKTNSDSADKSGVVNDGPKIDRDIDVSSDTVTLTASFSGFDSPECGIQHYEVAWGTKAGASDLSPYSPHDVSLFANGRGTAQITVSRSIFPYCI